MSKISDLVLEIQDMIIDGHSDEFIADQLKCPVFWVEYVREDLSEF